MILVPQPNFMSHSLFYKKTKQLTTQDRLRLCGDSLDFSGETKHLKFVTNLEAAMWERKRVPNNLNLLIMNHLHFFVHQEDYVTTAFRTAHLSIRSRSIKSRLSKKN